MEVKVQCTRGVRYAFDVEPVNGQLPSSIACPQCGTDGTAHANSVIAQKLAEQQSGQSPASGGSRLRVAVEHKPAVAASSEPAPGASSFCSRHPRTVATDRCVVCQK